MPAYERCMASGRHDARVQQLAAQALGFTGTPTFQFTQQASGKTYTLAGAQPVDVFVSWIDALLAGKEPPEAKPLEKAGATAVGETGGVGPRSSASRLHGRRRSLQGQAGRQARGGGVRRFR